MEIDKTDRLFIIFLMLSIGAEIIFKASFGSIMTLILATGAYIGIKFDWIVLFDEVEKEN